MEIEVQGYLTELNILRGQIREAIQGLSDEAANWHPLPEGTNSVYAMLSHFMGVDNFWVRQVINGEVVQRDREAEFHTSGSLSEMVSRWEEAWTEIEVMLGKLTSAQLSEARLHPFRPEKGTITVRWCILHLISHYAIHLGHIQLTRQLWENKHLSQH